MQTVKLGGVDPPSGRLDFSAASAEEPIACEWKFMVSARSSCYNVQSSCYNVQSSIISLPHLSKVRSLVLYVVINLMQE